MKTSVRELRANEFQDMHIAEVLMKLHEMELIPEKFEYSPIATIKLVEYDMEDCMVEYEISFDRWVCEWSELTVDEAEYED